MFLFKYFLAFLVVFLFAIWAFLTFHPVFGGTPDAQSQARIEASKAYNGQHFENLEPTTVLTGDKPFSWRDWILDKLRTPKDKNPNQALPNLPLRADLLKDGAIAWLGHSTVLMQLDDKVLLIDPVFYEASPVPFVVRPFALENPITIEDLPPIDAVLITHDHYDHLDYRAIRELKDKVAHFVVPLGVKAHLVRWGIAGERIMELDWDETTEIGNNRITLVPARHFSGRRLGGDFSTLWGGYVLASPKFKLYLSGDSGYGKHYADRIAPYAPFDFVLIENGAYNASWKQIHEMPSETAKALKDIKASRFMPIHWAKFDLSDHNWKAPIEQLNQNLANEDGIEMATPKIGQVFYLDEPLPKEKWWEGVE